MVDPSGDRAGAGQPGEDYSLAGARRAPARSVQARAAATHPGARAPAHAGRAGDGPRHVRGAARGARGDPTAAGVARDPRRRGAGPRERSRRGPVDGPERRARIALPRAHRSRLGARRPRGERAHCVAQALRPGGRSPRKAGDDRPAARPDPRADPPDRRGGAPKAPRAPGRARSRRVRPLLTPSRDVAPGPWLGVTGGVARPRGTRPLLLCGWAPSGRVAPVVAGRERVAPTPPVTPTR